MILHRKEKSLLWEAYQQTKIAGAQHTADRAVSKVDRHSNDIKELKCDVARLTLACQSMWELLVLTPDLTRHSWKRKYWKST